MYRKDGQVNKRKLERDDPNDNKNFLSVSRNNGYETIQMKTFRKLSKHGRTNFQQFYRSREEIKTFVRKLHNNRRRARKEKERQREREVEVEVKCVTFTVRSFRGFSPSIHPRKHFLPPFFFHHRFSRGGVKILPGIKLALSPLPTGWRKKNAAQAALRVLIASAFDGVN